MAKFDFRKFINQNSAVVTIGAVTVLVLALAAIVLQMQGPGAGARGPQDIWFYDLNTGELFVAKSNKLPPIAAPSDGTEQDENPSIPAGVKAHVFSCGSCQDEQERFIAYLETYPPDVRDKLMAFRENPPNYEEISEEDQRLLAGVEEAMMVRALDSNRWVNAMSEAGGEVTMAAFRGQQCPDGEPPTWCTPNTD